jgi:hypothetical protein
VHDINLWLVDALRKPGYLAGAEREAVATAVLVEEETLASVVGHYRIDAGLAVRPPERDPKDKGPDPLGKRFRAFELERETGFEPATLSLGS